MNRPRPIASTSVLASSWRSEPSILKPPFRPDVLDGAPRPQLGAELLGLLGETHGEFPRGSAGCAGKLLTGLLGYRLMSWPPKASAS